MTVKKRMTKGRSHSSLDVDLGGLFFLFSFMGEGEGYYKTNSEKKTFLKERF